jgi:hypothetical protein
MGVVLSLKLVNYEFIEGGVVVPGLVPSVAFVLVDDGLFFVLLIVRHSKIF